MTETETETRDYTGVTTEQIITEMLTEDTGRGLCDSGGIYGRNWQRNQGKTFSDQPFVTCTWSTYGTGVDNAGEPEMDATISLYHWMAGCLEFDPEMQARLDEFAQRDEMEDENWLCVQEAFAGHLHQLDGHEKQPNTINTCNDPDHWDCSQVLQYVGLYIEDSYEPSHLIVSVHGGCDVRGGYTAPKCFRLTEGYYTALDKACVQGLSAGNDSWRYDGGAWSGGCETSEDSRVPDPLELPCFNSAGVEQIPDPRETIPAQREGLKNTTLNEAQQAAANLEFDAAAIRLEAELLDDAIEEIGATETDFTLVHNRRLYLIVNAELVGEVTAYCDL